MKILGSATALTVFGLIFLVGCPKAPLEESVTLPAKDTNESIVVSKIRQVLSKFKTCEKIDDCDAVTVSLTPKKPSASSVGQRILVMDAGMLLPAYTRYKSRVLDQFFLYSDGQFKSGSEEIRIPRAVFEVLSDILDEQFPKTTAKELDKIADLFNSHRRILNHLVEHGDQSFATLADLNPNAEFIIADAFSFHDPDFCAAREDPAAREKLKLHSRRAAESLGQVIQKYNISFVNMSWGSETRKLKQTWEKHCDGKPLPPDTFFEEVNKTVFHEFFEPLFATPNVVFVQAAPYSDRPLSKGDAEFYSDCQSVPSRIVATGFSSKETLLPILGADTHPALSEFALGAMPCTDIGINFGISGDYPFEEGEFPILTSMNGVGASPIGTFPSSSTAAPIVISYFNYLRNAGLVSGEGSEFVANVKKYHKGKLVEPERYRQFEIYRLGRQ